MMSLLILPAVNLKRSMVFEMYQTRLNAGVDLFSVGNITHKHLPLFLINTKQSTSLTIIFYFMMNIMLVFNGKYNTNKKKQHLSNFYSVYVSFYII